MEQETSAMEQETSAMEQEQETSAMEQEHGPVHGAWPSTLHYTTLGTHLYATLGTPHPTVLQWPQCRTALYSTVAMLESITAVTGFPFTIYR